MSDIVRERKTEIGIGLFLLVSIGAFLIIPTVWSADTIILTNPSGGTPVSCLVGGGLILAQNLTDLCDVTIISPATNQLLGYNGSQWVNINGSVVFNDTTTCGNIGAGTIICAGGNVELKSLLGGVGIVLTNDTDEILITNTLPEATTASNLGANGQSVFSAEVANDLQFKKIVAGSSITVTSNSTNVIITNSAPESTTCTNQVTGIGLCINNDIDLKNLVNGTGIVITGNTTHVTFTNGGVISNQCNTGINCSGTNPSIFNTDFVNGTGMSITGSTSQTFTNTGVISNSCSNGIVCSGTNPSAITPTWTLLCENTLGSSATSISCGAFTAKRNIYFAVNINYLANATSTADTNLRFNGDTSANYAVRTSTNGGADSTASSATSCSLISGGTATNDRALLNYFGFNNEASSRKAVVGDTISSLSTAISTAPVRRESVCKWGDTASQITTISISVLTGTGQYNTGTHITVWGYD